MRGIATMFPAAAGSSPANPVQRTNPAETVRTPSSPCAGTSPETSAETRLLAVDGTGAAPVDGNSRAPSSATENARNPAASQGWRAQPFPGWAHPLILPPLRMRPCRQETPLSNAARNG
jgi:hypothetical protein